MARIASEVGTRGGQITPTLFKLDGDRVQLRYVWSDAEFHEPEIISKIAQHPDWHVLGRMMAENETWKSPDFRLWSNTFELRQQPIDGLPEARVASLHFSQ
jgi:hypothetical protein